MNRFMPFVLIATALCLHFSYCEWDVVRDVRAVGPSHYDRTIYYHRERPSRNVFLLSKTAESKDDAQTYGVALPALLCVGALAAWHFGHSHRSG